MVMTDQFRELLEAATVRPELTDYLDRQEFGDAELFREMSSGEAVFDHSEGRWFLWDGLHWKPDLTDQVYGLVGNQLAAEYLGASKEARQRGDKDLSERYSRRSEQLLNLRRVRNVLELASKLPRIGIQGSEWDVPVMLLPIANGVIDLSSGSFRQTVATDYFREYVPSEWHGLDYAAPKWEKLLHEIFGGDQEMIAFFQRLCGYAVSGDTREQVLPILWGKGSNGKSTIVDVLSGVLGTDFCFTTQSDSLMDVGRADGNGARPFVTALRNKRLVWASEGREGGRLNAGLVKQLTGDGYITARSLYAGPITFKQTHKIMLVTNHRPRLPDGGDEALWRRVLLVPFSESFVEDPKRAHEHRREKGLPAVLQAETPGILAWLVQGCLEWQAQGLNPPLSVIKSTARYHDEEDLIGQFVADRLIQQDDLEITAGALYEGYKAWCDDCGHRAVSSRTLGQRMAVQFGESVVKRVDDRPKRVYRGVGLVQ